MADILCGYTADRDETLVAYLYGDIEPAPRATFEAHMVTCERCRHELQDLRRARWQLQAWTAPELTRPLAGPALAPAADGRVSRPRIVDVLRDIPAWAQFAAALLVLGVSAGLAGAIAHLDVRYERGALTLHTGWSRPEARDAIAGTALPVRAIDTGVGGQGPWQDDLEALEQRLRTDFRASASSSPAAPVASAANAADAQLLRKVRALLDDSERRQRNELALRIAEVVQEFDTKRGTDLANIRSMRAIQSATGLEQVRQQQWLNLLTQASVQSR
jgi:anti-sigma factor RsiW